MIEGHGDDIYNCGQNVISNFSTNIFCKRNEGLEKFIMSRLHTIYSYPTPDAREICKIIAEKEQISEDNIIVTSGAVEAIYLIASAFRGHSSIISPTFNEYEDACKINRHYINYFSNIDRIPSNTNLVWICNPNNPDGRVFLPCDLEKVLSTNKDKVFIIDQAYQDYTSFDLFDTGKVLEYPNLIILKSLTKKFSLPGLRIGYMCASSNIIKVIKARIKPWTVNSLAIEAAKYCFSHENEFKVDVNALIKERDRITHELEKLGVTVYSSNTNFMLCSLPKGKASDLKKFLISNFGILIRDASNFHGLTERHFRVAAQTKNENDKLIKTIELWLKQF